MASYLGLVTMHRVPVEQNRVGICEQATLALAGCELEELAFEAERS